MEDFITAARRVTCTGKDMITVSTSTGHTWAGLATTNGSTTSGKDIAVVKTGKQIPLTKSPSEFRRAFQFNINRMDYL